MNLMFRAVAAVQNELLKQHPNGEYISLEKIVAAITGLTSIDEIIYVRFEADPNNPIWGEFTRWNQRPSVYATFKTIVEVRYAKHLTKPQYRFVVCKELCHALDAYDGSCVSRQSIENLVNAFAIASTGNKSKVAESVPAELNAEACAVELILPYQVRKKLIAQGAEMTNVAAQFGLPEEDLEDYFEEDYMQIIEELLG